MKATRFNLLTACVFLGAVSFSHAVDLHKADNNDGLGAATSWVENAVPGGTDRLIWDSTVTTARTIAATSGGFYGGVQILNPGGAVSLRVASNGTSTWNNNALIDMSLATQDVFWTGGTLRVASANFSPTFTIATGRTLTFDGGISNQGNTKTLTFAGAGNVVINSNSGGGGAMNFNVNGATVTMNNAASGWSYGTVASGSLVVGNSTVLDGKRLSVNAANGLAFGTGVVTASLGGLEGSGGFALTNADTNAVGLTIGSNNTSYSLTGDLTGGGSLTKVGSGTQTLSGNNSFSGGISLNVGAITFGNSNAAAGGTITAAGGTTLNLANSASVFLNGTVAASGAAANVTLTSGNISAGFATAFTGSSDQKMTISGTNQVNISTSGQQFSGMNGTVEVASGATLRFSSSSLNNGGGNTTFNLIGNLVTRNNGSLALGALTGTGNINMGGTGPNGAQLAITIGGKGSNASYSGVISDADPANGKIVNVTKTGSGIQTFAGANNYTGATTVSAGTLLVNGSLGNTAVAVNNGGTLGGTDGVIGTGTASVTVNNGGTLAPGSSPGTLTVNGSTTLNLGSNYNYQYTGGGTAADLLDVNGTLTINTGATLTLQDLASFNAGDKFTLFAYESLAGAFDSYADESISNFNGGDWLFNYDDSTAGLNGGTISGNVGSGFVTITAIPEPSAAMLFGGFSVIALLRRRRRA